MFCARYLCYNYFSVKHTDTAKAIVMEHKAFTARALDHAPLHDTRVFTLVAITRATQRPGICWHSHFCKAKETIENDFQVQAHRHDGVERSTQIVMTHSSPGRLHDGYSFDEMMIIAKDVGFLHEFHSVQNHINTRSVSITMVITSLSTTMVDQLSITMVITSLSTTMVDQLSITMVITSLSITMVDQLSITMVITSLSITMVDQLSITMVITSLSTTMVDQLSITMVITSLSITMVDQLSITMVITSLSITMVDQLSITMVITSLSITMVDQLSITMVITSLSITMVDQYSVSPW
ncbi:hypothetical protein QZH41_017149 [Actinostola sp. cb2023]|nr:hypothetical protein QZH41_017149 [Actinostola sp. cb2023]